nr:hypothetical protein OG781_07835 [Streptomyces sp. NBC_00830]
MRAGPRPHGEGDADRLPVVLGEDPQLRVVRGLRPQQIEHVLGVAVVNKGCAGEGSQGGQVVLGRGACRRKVRHVRSPRVSSGDTDL